LKNAGKALARFFAGIGCASHAMKKYDPYTLPLFSLTMIMDAEGLLARDFKRRDRRALIAQRKQEKQTQQ
jgi:hypothetical protein